MHRIGKLSILAALCSLLVLSGCGGTEEPASVPAETPVPETTATPTLTPEPEAAYEIIDQSFKSWPGLVGANAQGIVVVENTGDVDLYLDSSTFELEDAEGSLLCTVEYVSAYPQVLQPGEIGWFYEDSMFQLSEPAEGAVLTPRLQIKPATVDCIRFPLTDVRVEYDDVYKRLTLLGRVENTSETEQSMIYVAALLYGADDAPLGAIATIVQNVAPGTVAGFDQMALSLPEDITAEDVNRIDAHAWPYQFQFN